MLPSSVKMRDHGTVGLTLTELLVCIAVVAILATLALQSGTETIARIAAIFE